MLAARREQYRSCSNTEREREVMSIGGQVQPTHLTQPIGAAWIFRGEPRREAQPKRGAASQLYNFLDHGGKGTIPKMRSRSFYSGLKETKKAEGYNFMNLQEQDVCELLSIWMFGRIWHSSALLDMYMYHSNLCFCCHMTIFLLCLCVFIWCFLLCVSVSNFFFLIWTQLRWIRAHANDLILT